LLCSAWQHFELLRHGYKVEQMQRERAAEEEIARHLKVQIATLLSPERIETFATDRLHLVAPAPGEAAIVERVTMTDAPQAPTVARR
jgi:hypothetical protein